MVIAPTVQNMRRARGRRRVMRFAESANDSVVVLHSVLGQPWMLGSWAIGPVPVGSDGSSCGRLLSSDGSRSMASLKPLIAYT